jgi:hypothetical protein
MLSMILEESRINALPHSVEGSQVAGNGRLLLAIPAEAKGKGIQSRVGGGRRGVLEHLGRWTASRLGNLAVSCAVR